MDYMQPPEASGAWITQPPVPFSKTVSIYLGRLFTIKGTTPPNADRFSVNFFTGTPQDDVAIHIDNRFGESCVVRNSRLSDNWQKEERRGKFPLQRGTPFEMMVLVEEARFMIAYDGNHFAEFVHRFPLASVTSLTITGDVMISSYQESMTYPYVAMPGSPIMPVRRTGTIECFELPDGMNLGRKLHIGGVPEGDTFVIDMKPEIDSVEIGLHLSCRVRSGEIVLNSRVGEKWQKEIRPSNFSFKTGDHFDIEICARETHFSLVLNGYASVAFPVRHIAARDLRALVIHGSVKVSFVTNGLMSA